jgi:hypothetical protein
MFRHRRLKNGEQTFVGFASIDMSDGISWKFRIAKIASTFTAEALAIGETREIIEKIGSKQTFVIFSGSESVLNGISNTSHITQMLQDKIDWNRKVKKIRFPGS